MAAGRRCSGGRGRPAARWSRPARVAFVAAACALLAGLFLWLRPLPSSELALFGAGYQENLAIPHNAYGLKGLYALGDLVNGAEGGTVRSSPAGLKTLHPAPSVLANESQLYDDLSLPSSRTTLLFLALHGADDRGPFLYLDRERPDALPAKLYLSDLIGRIKELSPRRFILILDATQVAAIPQLGILHNDFAARLQGLTREIEGASNLRICSIL